MNARREHWETVYATKSAEQVSWYQPSPDISLAMIRDAGPARNARVIDVGGGASRLADHLLGDVYSVTVLDIAASGLELSKRRLGSAAAQVEWVVADVTSWRPALSFDVWHDRAVFHFLTDEADRHGYLGALRLGLRAGGQAIIGAFAPDGPERCSGLPVRRYDPGMLARELGDGFSLEDARAEEHGTPAGQVQRFVHCRFRHVG